LADKNVARSFLKWINMKFNIICYSLYLLVFLGCNNQIKNSSDGIIRSGEIWKDNNGIHINAHGGGVIFSNGKYYWFGEHKIEGRKGNRAQVGVHCYSSKDLVNWFDEGIALKVIENDTAHPIAKGCILERPKVIYNKKNDIYVMWFHLELPGNGYSSALTGVAKSETVKGPYKFVNALRPNANAWPVGYPDSLKVIEYNQDELKAWSKTWTDEVKKGMFLKRDFEKGQMSRDMTLYKDENGKAYHIHASEENLTLHISELTDDFLNFSGVYFRVLPAGHNEAPTMFKRKDKYYMITSGCTGWEPNAARLLMADSINGDWEYIKNPCVGPDSAITFHAQSTFVLSFENKKFIFMADKWRPGNPVDGRYVWLPIHFDENDIPYVKWYDEWKISEI